MSNLIIPQLSKLGFLITVLLYSCAKIVDSKCESVCNLGLASYYVEAGDTLDVIASYFNNVSSITDIVSYNRVVIPNEDSLLSRKRINVPFPCGCVNHTFLGHVFTYVFQKGDTFDTVAQFNYTNLTTVGWIQEFNTYNPDNVPDAAIISVPVNCSCGNSSVSMDYGLFITYPLRQEDSLSSISKQFGLNKSLLQGYNPGANFSAGDGIVYIPGKDESGNYLPLVLRNTSGPGLDGGVIAGICMAVVIIIIILSVGVYLRCIRKKKMNKASLLPEKSKNQLSGSISQAGGAANIPGIYIDKSVQFRMKNLRKQLIISTSALKLVKVDSERFTLRSLEASQVSSHGTGFLRFSKAAIKKMDVQASKEFFAELKVLTHVHHLNLVRLLGYCVESSLFLVYEYNENGNLSEHLHSSGKNPLQWLTRVRIALDSARGLEYIHEHTVPLYIHRDIKPANILINNNFQAKVADFGLAKLSDVGNGTLPTRLVGTFGYMPPEYAQFGEVTPKVDVFAFGVVLYELISAKEAVVRQSNSAVEMTSLTDLFENVLSKPDPNEITKLIDPGLGDDYPLESVRQVAELAKACTQDKPHLRPSMKSVVVALTTLLSATRNWISILFMGTTPF